MTWRARLGRSNRCRRDFRDPGLALSSLWAAIWLLACGKTPLPLWLLHVQASSTAGHPLPAVEVWQGSRYLGSSDGRGELWAQLTAAPGATLPWLARCPPGFTFERGAAANESETLFIPERGGRTLDDLRIRCRPMYQTTTIVIRTSGVALSSLPILLDGQPIGQTERDGTAHLRLRFPLHDRVRISLDTSIESALRPQDPVHTFEVSEHPPLWLIDQPFVRVANGDPEHSSLHP